MLRTCWYGPGPIKRCVHLRAAGLLGNCRAGYPVRLPGTNTCTNAHSPVDESYVRMPAGDSSLELRNLTLLLPPLPEEAATAATAGSAGALPPSLLAHVIEAVGGGGNRAQVVLRGVTLVAGACR